MNELFVVGSEPILTGIAYDRTNLVRQAKDLTGAAIFVRAILNGGTVKIWNATANPDQVTNRGKFTYQMGSSDIDAVGIVELQAWVTLSGKTTKSGTVVEEAQRSLS